MPLQLVPAASLPSDARLVGVPVFVGDPVPGLDGGELAARGFEGRVGQWARLGDRDGRVVLALGLGPRDQVDLDVLRRAAAALVRGAWRDGAAATTLLEARPDGVDPASAAQALAEGAALAAYRFTRFKADPKPCRLETLTVVGEGDEVADGLRRGQAVAGGVVLARDLVNTPPGRLTPTDLAATATEVAGAAGLAVEVVDEAAAAELGLGGLLGVGAGSDNPPRLVRLTYEGRAAHATVGLVGKGITFDSGGLSLKTADGMMAMKNDMSGAAAVLGAMSVLPALAPPVKVVGWLCLAENMPSGRATRPGDVLRIRNGTTVEVLNTDAEGRLVLADGLSLAVEEGVDAIVDLATLTGACVVALGPRIAGVMGNHDGLVAQVGEAARRAGEPMWPLPLPAEYRPKLDSDVADVKNVTNGRYGGALTAGLFLQEFVGDVPWAHLDIAGPASSEEDEGYLPKGGTGFGVRTLLELLTSFQPVVGRGQRIGAAPTQAPA